MAVSISVNSTVLHINHWRNGSLFPQIQNNFTNAVNDVGNFSNTAVWNGNLQDQGLELTILENNVAQLTINASGFSTDMFYNTTLASTFALTETLFDPNAARRPVTCIYPISGQYDTLSRALFYVLMVFSLLFRRHIWISVAALGTAMTYAGTSAVHLFALTARFGFKHHVPAFDVSSSQQFADVDIIGILPILSASAIMVTPILLWSTTVRKFDAQAIIVWWGILIFTALAVLLGEIFSSGFNLNELESFAICAKDCIPEDDFFSLQVYQKCNCMDFCGTLGPSAPMRNGANMVAILGKKTFDNIILKNGFQDLFAINFMALSFIIVYGAMGIIISRFSPDEVRNGIFRFFNSDLRLWLKVIFEGDREHRALSYFGVQQKDDRRTVWRKVKYIFAKLMATSFSLTVGATVIICPAVFISSVVANEIMIQSYPVSEHSDAIGAWGQWIGAGLVLIAAVINKWGGSWMQTLKVMIYSLWRHVKYSKDDRTKLYPRREGWSVERRAQLFGLVIVSPPVHAWWSLARGFWTVKTTLHFFAMWWRETETISQQRGDEIQAAWEAEQTKAVGGMPVCHCYVCKHDEEKLEEREMKETKKHEAKNEEVKKQQGGYEAAHSTSDVVLLPIQKASSTSSHVDGISHAPAKTDLEIRPDSAADVPLPAPRNMFPRQNTDSLV